MSRSLMIQGTGSGVGKSILVAALCRIFHQEGYCVAPFKAQNMALNSGVTRDGREMGRAQIVQAQAAGIDPRVEMNPILIKPDADTSAQVMLLGEVLGDMSALDYHQYKPRLVGVLEESLRKLEERYELIVIEGAGSPAEVNLREGDIVNMRTAELAGAPVILVGDIDRGGVFAWLVGTLELLTLAERARVKGFIINKFRGDISLLEPGLHWLEQRTDIPVLGVIPYFHHIHIPEEDAVPLWAREAGARRPKEDEVEIAVVYLPHISNFTDFDPLAQETGVLLRYARLDEELGQPDAVIIPGTKSTLADLRLLWEWGMADQILRLAKSGVPIVGICGGYQILGGKVTEGQPSSGRETVAGLGLLEVETRFAPSKALHQLKAEVIGSGPFLGCLRGQRVEGYEIHMGQSEPAPGVPPAFLLTERSGCTTSLPDGAVHPEGEIWGTYIHGLFENDPFRLAFVNHLRARKGLAPLQEGDSYRQRQEQAFDELAELVRSNLNLKLLFEIISLEGGKDAARAAASG